MKILSIDFGDRYTGVAACDEGEVLASPLCVINEKDMSKCAVRVAETAAAEHAERIVVGNPLNMDGSAGFRSRKSEKFAGLLRAVTDVEVVTHDERGSTADASELLAETKKRKKNRHGKISNIDAAAAAVILQSYLREKHYFKM